MIFHTRLDTKLFLSPKVNIQIIKSDSELDNENKSTKPVMIFLGGSLTTKGFDLHKQLWGQQDWLWSPNFHLILYIIVLSIHFFWTHLKAAIIETVTFCDIDCRDNFHPVRTITSLVTHALLVHKAVITNVQSLSITQILLGKLTDCAPAVNRITGSHHFKSSLISETDKQVYCLPCCSASALSLSMA